MTLLAVPLGLAIGLALGMLGGGGSVLAVPVLVHVLDQDVHAATTASLVVVAAAALAGGASQARGGQVCWSHAAVFAPAAVAGAAAGTAANTAASAGTLIAGFALLMLGAAWFTWRSARGVRPGVREGACPPLRPGRVALAGVVVGALTGFFGVGGGFLVVPLLALAMRFPLRRAIGTSLVIVGFVSVVAALAHFLAGNEVDWGVTVALAAACAAGAVAGGLVAPRVPQRVLGQAFAVLLVAVAGYLLVAPA